MTQHKKNLLIGIFLALITLACYWNAQHLGFVNLDDGQYVTQNPHVKAGLTRHGFSWAFAFNGTSYWHPLTWLSHMVDCQLYGLNPVGHHFSSLILHIANTILLFLALQYMTGATWRSLIVAALFALHPLNVESVVWIADRKNVLSTFFWMLTMWFYAQYARKPATRRYLLVLVSLALGLMAKPMLVTLPFVLLLLDYWPLQRFETLLPEGKQTQLKQREKCISFKKASTHWLLLEKVPLVALSIISVAVSSLSSKNIGMLVSTETVPIWLRVKNALVSYIIYIQKMIWPVDLAVFYPYPKHIPFWQLTVACLVLATITGAVLRTRKQGPYLSVGWLWYLGTLIPVIGLVQQGLWPALADRFSYVPLIGLFVAITWGISDLVSRLRVPRFYGPALASIVLVLLAVGTVRQVRYWKNSVSLFEHTLRVTTGNHLAHYNLGPAFYKRRDLDRAISQYSKALKIMPDNAQFHNSLGTALLEKGDLRKAIKELSKALTLVPNYAEAHVNMGIALAKAGKTKEAISHYEHALKISPLPEAHHNLALILAGQGHLEQAIYQYKKALELKPDSPSLHNDLAVALFMYGRPDEAIFHLRKALAIKPDYAQAQHNLKTILHRLKKKPPQTNK